MRLPRRGLVISLVIALVIAAGLVITLRVHSSSQASGSTASPDSAGKQFLISGVSTKSQTPYRLGANLYVNDPAAWKQLSSAAQSGLLAKLNQAERNFRAVGKQVFPSPQLLTVKSVPSSANSTTSVFRLGSGDATLTAWSQSQPVQVTTDFGATALGDQPFSLGTAVYRGYTSSGLFGWAPCASTNPSGSAHVVKICGGQALAGASGAREAGMTGAMVTVIGTAAAQADLPIIANYTNHSAHTEKVTVTGTVASVTMTMFASLLGAGCERSALKYTTPASGIVAPPLPNPPVISLDGCLGTFHEQVLLPGALQLSAAMSAAQGVTTAIGDDLLAVKDKPQLSSSPALQACTIGRTLSDLAAVIKDFGGLGVPSCEPEALPRWTGTVAAGATVQFSITPATQAISLGTGGEVAGLFTFADLHVSTSSTTGPVTTIPPTPAFYYANAVLPEKLYVSPTYPKELAIDNHDGIAIQALDSWGPATMTMTGTLTYDECQPACAAGPIVTFPVRVIAAAPQTCTLQVDQQGSPLPEKAYVYSNITVKALSGNPPTQLVGNSVFKVCNAAPTQNPPTQQSPAPFAVTSSSPTSGRRSADRREIPLRSGRHRMSD